MTAKISDCKNETRRKIKQVISVERKRETERSERGISSDSAVFLSSSSIFTFSHTCGNQAHKGHTVTIVQ